MSHVDRKLIFDAAKARGARFTSLADVKAMDAAIDALIAGLSGVPCADPAPVVPAAMTKWQAMVDTALLKMAFPANNVRELALWVEPVRAALIRWGIDTPREIASFLANINVECRSLTVMEESLNYSTEALIAKFGRHRISIAQANQYGRNASHPANQEALANILYGGEFGLRQLGNIEPGDGWAHRGYGPKQITGRANQQKFADAMGIRLEDVPAFVRTREGGMMSAGWFWQSHNLDAKAATPGVEDDRRAINGGVFGLADVERVFDALLEEMLRRELAR